MRERLALVLLTLAPRLAAAQGATLDCQAVPTFFPRGDHWALGPTEVLGYRTHVEGSADVSGGADIAAVDRAFATWIFADCSGSEPNVRVVNAYSAYGSHYPTRDRGEEYDGDGNLIAVENIVYWIEVAADWPGDSLTLALTTNLYLPDTGVIVTSDMEFNGANWQWRARQSPGGAWVGCTVGGAQCYDIETVAVHEAGHFLGFNHVECTDAVMYARGGASLERTALSVHELTGLCAVYVPRPASVPTARFFGEQCNADGDCPDGLCITPVGLEGSGWGWCSKACDCTEGCASACPQAYVCARQQGGSIDFCKPGVHLTGGTTGGCACDTNSACQSGCVCDDDCTTCVDNDDCTGGKVCLPAGCSPCTSSPQCSNGEVCVAGRCIPCVVNADCAAGQVCAAGRCGPCTSSAQCSNGRICSGGTCVDCSGNASCSDGLVCLGGGCTLCTGTPQCTSPATCQNGHCRTCPAVCAGGWICLNNSCAPCSSTPQCSDGKVCRSGSCVPCQGTAECMDGLVCVDGACDVCIGNSECLYGQVCASGTCVACSSSNQCDNGLVCNLGRCTLCSDRSQCETGEVCGVDGRCVIDPNSGGGTVDPDTGLSRDFGAPCTTGTQCSSGLCITDEATQSRCTQACVPGALPGGVTPAYNCPAGFDCQATDFGAHVCWPDDPAAWSGNAAGSGRANLNDLCFQAMTTSTTDDWYLPCGPDLVCFNFRPRCEGQEGACVPYCDESLPCPDRNQTCCFGVDAEGNCLGPSLDRVHGGCFDLREEGESCVTAERSICAEGLGCYHFGEPRLARCYRHCASAACASGATCTQFHDTCSNAFSLCCADAYLPDACEPGQAPDTALDLGYACTVDGDCASEMCETYAGRSGCSRSCNEVTGFGCPDASYDVDGDGVGDGGFDCVAGGFCWPRQGPLAVPEPEPEPEPTPKKKPPAGSCDDCSAAGPPSLAGLALGWLWWRARRRRT